MGFYMAVVGRDRDGQDVHGLARQGGAHPARHGPRLGQKHLCGLVFEAHRLCASLESRIESNKEEDLCYSARS